MKNIAFDHSGTIQLDAICMDGALDLSTNGQILGEYVAFYFRAFVYQNGQCPKLALDVAEDLYCAFAGNSSDDGMPRLIEEAWSVDACSPVCIAAGRGSCCAG